MKFGIIYKPHLAKTKGMIVEADTWRELGTERLGFKRAEVFIEHVVDFEGQRIIPVAMDVDGKLVEIINDTYGEGTTNEMLARDYKK